MGTETEGFAEALRGLKERSGLSYGALAKRGHMSTSTLHRYCNGDAVPTEFAPVERLARLCGASRDEMVALHRRWIVADDARRRGRAPAPEAALSQRPDGAGRGGQDPVPVPDPSPEAGAESRPGTAESGTRPERGPDGRPDSHGTPEPADEPVAAYGRAGAARGRAEAVDGGGPAHRDGPGPGHGAAGPDGRPGPGDGTEEGRAAGPGEGHVAVLAAPADAPGAVRARRRGRLVAAAAALVVLIGSTALALTLTPGHGDRPDEAAGPVERAAASVGAAAGRSGSPGPAPSPSTSAPAAPSPSAPSGAPAPTAPATAAPAAAPSGAAPPAGAVPGRRGGGVPLTVDVRPYVWRDPCSQVYVVDRPPAQVPPPPSEQDARGWVTALGGAPGGDMMMDLSVQGTGQETVVLHALRVRVVEKDAPLAWNAYTMGVGCGGEMTPRSLDINLDVARPRTVPVAGRQGDREIPAGDFPYKVSASDPQMLRVTAHTAGHAVRWYLELEWSSGGRRGTLRVDDHGRPFATSAVTGRPAYDYPLGGSGWIPHVPNEG
ncbi:helix-turn-helix transcriptional regulator [Streptomyces lavendofoliae]|uniref:helix-turn-helix domain-containing protein n=1 Tax=Streptomyces lavendofoliae TaxID=67314 RepID=UPI00300F3AD0